MATPIPSKIVILEKNISRRDRLRRYAAIWGYRPFCFADMSICLDNIGVIDPKLVIVGTDSLEGLSRFIHTQIISASFPPTLVLSHNQAIEDFLSFHKIEHFAFQSPDTRSPKIRNCLEKLVKFNGRPKSDAGQEKIFVGNSSYAVGLKALLTSLKDLRPRILLQGEPGTGKSLITRMILRRWGTEDKDLFKINCAVDSPPDPAEKSLERAMGAKSWLSGSWGGPLLLENIDQTPPGRQARLLLLFEENGPGGIIATSRTNLAGWVAAGRFRRDLFFRLNEIQIDLQPLRNIPEDTLLLADFFKDIFCRRLNKSHFDFSESTRQILCAYQWPENGRELRSAIRRLVQEGYESSIARWLKNSQKLIKIQKLMECRENFETASEPSGIREDFSRVSEIGLKGVSRKYVDRAEKQLIEKFLDYTQWNRRKAALLLGISYKSLLNKINYLNLS